MQIPVDVIHVKEECWGFMELDPSFTTTQQWAVLGQLTTALHLNVLFAIVIAFDWMIAHAVIPSLVESNHIPRSVNKVRPFFYFVSIAAAIGLVIFLASRIELLQVVYEIYDRKWY